MIQRRDAIREETTTSIAELLGHAPDAKLLIIHADDLGMAHSINLATFAALNQGAISSASVMVNCPWFAEVVAYAAEHPGHDIGVHLTVTSEWKLYKWGPISKRERLPGLVDQNGHFWEKPGMLQATAERVEHEIEAQIKLAIGTEIRPTHLDSHMFALFTRPDYFGRYLSVARNFGLPAFIHPIVRQRPRMKDLVTHNDVIVDFTFMADPSFAATDWKKTYIHILRALTPGLSQMIVHLGYDDGELRAITAHQDPWGASWRQRDFDLVTSAEFSAALYENDIRLVTWANIKSALEMKQRELRNESARSAD